MDKFLSKKKEVDAASHSSTRSVVPGCSKILQDQEDGKSGQLENLAKRKNADDFANLHEEEGDIFEQQKKKKKYLNKFSLAWLSIPEFKGWLEKSKEKNNGNEQAFCNVCKANIAAHKSDISRHNKSEKHVQNLKKIESNKDIKDVLNNPTPQQQKRAELKLAAFIADKNLPISCVDDLGELIPNIFHDSKIAKTLSIHRTKATALIKKSLSFNFKDELVSNLKDNLFSIIIDETTDKGSVKQCAFVVVYFDEKENLPKTRFLDMRELESSTAVGILAGLKKVLNENEIPVTNLIGYSSDTTNVMFGEYHSVVSLLKAELPQVVCIKCSCHLIHLVASKACLKLPRSIEDLLRNLGSHFSRSYSRQKKLQEFQEFFSVEIHKILTVANTRWLSIKQAVDRVLEQYPVIQAYLRETVFSDPSKTTEEMLSTMDNSFTEIYLEFLSYALGIFTSFNLIFQTESPMLHKVKPATEDILKKLCFNFLKMDSLKKENIFQVNHMDSNNFLEEKKIYIGIKAQESLEKLRKDPNVPREELKTFLNSCQNFYIEAVSQIKKKFDLSDPIFHIVEAADPITAQHSEEYPSLLPIFQRFPVVKSLVCIEKAEEEWRNHKILNYNVFGLNPELPADQYWKKVFALKDSAGQLKFMNLKKVIKLLLILPFSNACVERVFSNLTNIKTLNRNRLNSETITALMLTKEGIAEGGGIKSFEPTKEMFNASIWKTQKSDV